MFKKSLSMAAAAALLATVAPAHAAVFSGEGSYTGDASIETGGSGQFKVSGLTAGSFSDTLTFSTTAGLEDISITFTAIATHFSSLTATLDGVALDLYSTGSGATLATAVSAAVASGAHTLVISGVDTYTKGKAGYAGTLTFTAVPEPATWGLSILGFGLVGGALRSRRRQVANLRLA